MAPHIITMTQSQGSQEWKEAAGRMHISAYNPLLVEFANWKPIEEVEPKNVEKEDEAVFGTHVREAIRILRSR